MTEQELTIFSDFNPHITIDDDIDNNQLVFRDESLFQYQNNEDFWTAVKYDKMDEITEKELVHAIKDGFQVEQMSRVTGYYAKISGWNKGKRAELKERNRMEIDGKAIMPNSCKCKCAEVQAGA